MDTDRKDTDMNDGLCYINPTHGLAVVVVLAGETDRAVCVFCVTQMNIDYNEELRWLEFVAKFRCDLSL